MSGCSYFEACEGDILDACSRLSQMALTGFKDAVEKNLGEAFHYGKREVVDSLLLLMGNVQGGS